MIHVQGDIDPVPPVSHADRVVDAPVSEGPRESLTRAIRIVVEEVVEADADLCDPIVLRVFDSFAPANRKVCLTRWNEDIRDALGQPPTFRRRIELQALYRERVWDVVHGEVHVLACIPESVRAAPVIMRATKTAAALDALAFMVSTPSYGLMVQPALAGPCAGDRLEGPRLPL
jgi:hypothetical protein